jgi:HK97 family phage major capsid protein
MPQPYKNTDTAWLMSPEAEKTIRLLVDTTNQYLWQPGLKQEPLQPFLVTPSMLTETSMQ